VGELGFGGDIDSLTGIYGESDAFTFLSLKNARLKNKSDFRVLRALNRIGVKNNDFGNEKTKFKSAAS